MLRTLRAGVSRWRLGLDLAPHISTRTSLLRPSRVLRTLRASVWRWPLDPGLASARVDAQFTARATRAVVISS